MLDRQIKDGLDGVTRRRSPSSSSPTSRSGRSAPGRNATAAQAQEAHAHIRGRASRQWFGADAAERCHVLYGGSVKPDNIARAAWPSPTSTARWSAGASLDVQGFADMVLAEPAGCGIIDVSGKAMICFYYLVTGIYVLVCLLLLLVVLLQQGKGGDMAARSAAAAARRRSARAAARRC